jgi:iron complex transport system permease protein
VSGGSPLSPIYRRIVVVSALLAVTLLVLMLLSAGVGSQRPGIAEAAGMIWAKATGRAIAGETEWTILWQLRLPRVVLAALVGASLSLAGTATQGLLQNPLADPYILGVSSGAALGAALGILFGWEGALHGLGLTAVAFAGALATLALVLALARVGGRVASHNFLLAGVVVGSFLWALLTLALAYAGQDLQRLLFWLMGSLYAREWIHVTLLAPITLAGGLALWLYARDLNLLSLGDTAAQQLGVAVEPMKLVVIGIAAMLTAAAVSVSGIIGFVGLVVPHMARRVVGPDHRLLLPASGLAGAGFLLVADTIVRGLLAVPVLSELPVGVVTALAGAPVFCFLLRRGK